MYSFLGPLRPRVRAAFFRFFEQALSTDDGKRALIDALGGVANGGRPAVSIVNWPAPYPDVGRRLSGRPGPPPVFVTARFRTGSTLVWNLFRQLPDCVAFYEPLDERRWFDPSTRGTHVDATHHGITDYWREYDGLPHLARWYQQRWMDHRSWVVHAWTFRAENTFLPIDYQRGTDQSRLGDMRAEVTPPGHRIRGCRCVPALVWIPRVVS